jgi:serine protease Do
MFRKFTLTVIIATFCAVGFAQQSSSSRIISGGDVFSGFAGESYFGVEPIEITKQNMSKFGLSEVSGVAVEKVVENSPAQQAGLQNGDVIISINGDEVSSIRKLSRLISEIAPDHQAKLKVLRNGEEREISVTLAKRPMPKFDGGAYNMRVPLPILQSGDGQLMRMPVPNLPSSDGEILVIRGDENGTAFYDSSRQIGVGVTLLSKQLGDYFGVPDGKGLLINNVRENSPAAKAGLKAGDVIIEVEGKSVSNQTQLIRGIYEKKDGEVLLTIIRDKNRQSVKIAFGNSAATNPK